MRSKRHINWKTGLCEDSQLWTRVSFFDPFTLGNLSPMKRIVDTIRLALIQPRATIWLSTRICDDTSKALTQKQYDSLPDFMESKEHSAVFQTSQSLSSVKHIVSLNRKVRAQAQSRANKACSYCRTSGHTVRTCKKVESDKRIHHTAFKISAYRYATALSRFGLWTGSMALVDGKARMMDTVAFYPKLLAYDIKALRDSGVRDADYNYSYRDTDTF